MTSRGLSLEELKKMKEITDLADPVQRRDLTVLALSITVALRGGEATKILNSQFSKGEDSHGAFISFNPTRVKNLAFKLGQKHTATVRLLIDILLKQFC